MWNPFRKEEPISIGNEIKKQGGMEIPPRIKVYKSGPERDDLKFDYKEGVGEDKELKEVVGSGEEPAEEDWVLSYIEHIGMPFEEVLKLPVLNDREREFLYGWFVEKRSLSAIAKDFRQNTEHGRKTLNNALKKLRNHFQISAAREKIKILRVPSLKNTKAEALGLEGILTSEEVGIIVGKMYEKLHGKISLELEGKAAEGDILNLIARAVNDNGVVTPWEKGILKSRYILGKTSRQVGEELNISIGTHEINMVIEEAIISYCKKNFKK